MSTGTETVRLQIHVRPSPETHDHEVVLLGNEQDLVDRFGDCSIGMDPDDILVEPSTLLGDQRHQCVIGRCECGVIGCGDVVVEVSAQGSVVCWAPVRGNRERVYFDRELYEGEVQRALSDHAWETPERTASRFIRVGVDRSRLERAGLTFSWASGRAAVGYMTVALWLEPGPYQLLVRVPSSETDVPRATADSVLELLAQSPATWPNVEWIPQAPKLGPPTIAGAGWRRWQF
jgi:hypothetical protein